MIVIGMSLTAARATTAILTALPVEKAGIGSAVNDTTREVGTALGIAAAAAFADAFSLANSISVAVVLTTAAAVVALHRRTVARRPLAGPAAGPHRSSSPPSPQPHVGSDVDRNGPARSRRRGPTRRRRRSPPPFPRWS